MDPESEKDFNDQWNRHGGRKALQGFSRRTSNDMRSLMGGHMRGNNNRDNDRRRIGNNAYDRDDRSNSRGRISSRGSNNNMHAAIDNGRHHESRGRALANTTYGHDAEDNYSRRSSRSSSRHSGY